MRTLVINLTRFGDLLQTQPVLSGLKELGHEVGLVCLENFSGATVLLKNVDRVFPLPGAWFLSQLNKDWRQGVDALWRFGGRDLRGFEPDLVVNLTSSVPARLLAGLIGGREVRGFCMDEFGFGMHSNPWAAFLMASARHRGASPFNLVDLFIKAACLEPGKRELDLNAPGHEARQKARDVLATQAPADAVGFVALQLGASSDVRRWPIGHFAETARALWQNHRLCAVLLGSGAEKELGQRFTEACQSPCVNLIGKTSFAELAAVLTRVRMLITNDTGTMHLAAGLGVPVAAMFLATAQPWDTGPYRSGCLCLEPDADCHPCGYARDCPHDNACRTMITPQAVLRFLEPYLNGQGWKPMQVPDVRAWVSGLDSNGFMDLGSLTGQGRDDRSVWIAMQRKAYRQFLDQESVTSGWDGPVLSRGFAGDLLNELRDSQKLLLLILEQARLMGRSPAPQFKTKFLNNWERLTARWTESRLLSVLGDLWREESQQVAEDTGALERMVLRYSVLLSTLTAFVGEGGTDIE